MPKASDLLSWGSFTFDSVISVSIQDQMLVSQHTLESGALVTDHSRSIPTPIACSVIYTDVGNGTGSADQRYLDLLSAMAASSTFELLAACRLFLDCALTSVSRTWQKAEGAARLDLVFQPLKFTSGSVEAIPSTFTRRASASQAQGGKVQPTTTNAAGLAKASSLLNDLVFGGS